MQLNIRLDSSVQACYITNSKCAPLPPPTIADNIHLRLQRDIKYRNGFQNVLF